MLVNTYIMDMVHRITYEVVCKIRANNIISLGLNQILINCSTNLSKILYKVETNLIGN